MHLQSNLDDFIDLRCRCRWTICVNYTGKFAIFDLNVALLMLSLVVVYPYPEIAGGAAGSIVWGGSGKIFTWPSGPQLDLDKGVGLNPFLKSATERDVEL